MKKSIKVDKKRGRGRPATGQAPMVSSRIPAESIAAVDDWAAKNGITRSQAIARLVELGLTVRAKPNQATAKRATRAKELASKAIEKIADPLATQEERVQRRRRLTKGPQEFREDRVDLPETKRGK